MEDSQNIYYRYRAFNINTLDNLCLDTLYFSNPGSFNDPLDCKPTLECDSSDDELRTLLAILIKQRVEAEVYNNLKRAKIKDGDASRHASFNADNEAVRELDDIAYHATNPEHEVSVTEAESLLLVYHIELELLKYYERGVCCFSKSCSNPLLWSHYGDQHKGICIGYGIERKPMPQFHKVDYDGGRSIYTSTLKNAFIDKDESAKRDLDHDVLLRKAREWECEEEWRLIGKQGIQDSPLLLKEVIFGLRCKDSIKHAVVTSLEGRQNDIEFFEMHTERGSYALKKSALDFRAFLPKTAISADEAFAEVNLETIAQQ